MAGDDLPTPSEGSEASWDGSECYYSEYEWTVEFMELTPELHMRIFCKFSELKDVVALRLSCRQLNEVYLAKEKDIFRSLREHIIAPIREYYEFLLSMVLPVGSVRQPPSSGWPNITVEACAGYEKIPFAVEVLKHLPVIVDEHEPYQSMTTNIGYKSHVVDFSSLSPEDFDNWKSRFFYEETLMETQDEDWEAVDDYLRIASVKHLITLAEGYESGGVHLVLDVFNGNIFHETQRVGSGPQCLATQYFEERIQELRRLDEVFVPGYDPLMNYGGQDEEYNAEKMESQGEPAAHGRGFGHGGGNADYFWVRHLYRKFGWPDKGYKKDECLEAISQYAERRNQQV